MGKTVTSRYDVAEHLRTPEEMAAYFEACLEEAKGGVRRGDAAGGGSNTESAASCVKGVSCGCHHRRDT